MRMKKGDLSVPALLMMGGALYSMHFGASSMVWPMTWGKESGSSVFIAFIGAFITSLFLPLLAYVALARVWLNGQCLSLVRYLQALLLSSWVLCIPFLV